MIVDCGIKLDRIATWLDEELQLGESGQNHWLFSYEDQECTVTLAPLENRTIASLELERTELSIDGDQAAVDAFYRLFELRFMSAGG